MSIHYLVAHRNGRAEENKFPSAYLPAVISSSGELSFIAYRCLLTPSKAGTVTEANRFSVGQPFHDVS